MKLLYAGIDTIQLAFKATLPSRFVDALRCAKKAAADQREAQPLELSEVDVGLLVHDYGARGGFAFAANTGPAGAIWNFRDDDDSSDWNIYVKPTAVALLAHGYHGAVQNILSVLKRLDVRIEDHSVSRVDYAFDIRTEDFVLDPRQFVAHARAKRVPHWAPRHGGNNGADLGAVLRGQEYQSFRIGAMPGRQLIIYDKTAELSGATKTILHEAWRLPPDTSARVWRVEVRAGKEALRHPWRIRHLPDLEAKLRDLLLSILRTIRYVEKGADSNVSRRPLDPIWRLVMEHAQIATLIVPVGKIEPGRVEDLDRAQKLKQHENMIVGNAAGIAALMGLSDSAVQIRLPKMISNMIERGTRRQDGEVMKSVGRARKRHPIQGNRSK